MEFVIGIGVSFVTKAAEYMIHPIKYISDHEKNVKTLKDRAERLEDARTSVQHSIDEAKRNGEEIEDEVVNWMSKAST
ncbi:hypothetical protein V6N12_045828 [Hibiscus sabdariffa]|uniref:Uncharacterized protein n=1 Tax=Hibiscus sabdariffa TaxID=183260 RepID=A0ABR2G4U1_9ROSI